MSWWKISDHIEKILSHKEGRRVIPRGGIETTKKLYKNPAQRHLKVNLQLRPWSWARCRHAYENWPMIAQSLRKSRI